jgi:NADP-dependent 3-hydroxy acid dehydrogenase YdfG
MSTILVAGYGPGISTAVAEKFGKEGFSVALVARSAEKLSAGAKSLEAKGIKAAAFPADLSDPAAVRAAVAKVRSALGPIAVLHWNAYAGVAGDLIAASTAELRTIFDVAVVCLITAVQEALPDLRKEKNAAVLVTNGGFAYPDPPVDAAGVSFNVMGLSVANAAKHKVVGLLAEKLRPEGIHVGEVMVRGTVKGTPWDSGGATLEGTTIANAFWTLYTDRSEVRATVT